MRAQPENCPREGYEADAAFAAMFPGRRLDAIAREHATVYGVWPDLALALVNAAFWSFAFENGAASDFRARFGLGTPISRGISGPQRAFYEDALQRVLATGRPWRHVYRCPSVDVDRTFHLEVVPVGGRRGLLLTHVPQLITPRRPAPEDGVADASRYVDASGLLHQCGHCRRVRRCDDPSRWDWVVDWADHPPPRAVHELCRLCLELHYTQR